MHPHANKIRRGVPSPELKGYVVSVTKREVDTGRRGPRKLHMLGADNSCWVKPGKNYMYWLFLGESLSATEYNSACRLCFKQGLVVEEFSGKGQHDLLNKSSSDESTSTSSSDT